MVKHNLAENHFKWTVSKLNFVKQIINILFQVNCGKTAFGKKTLLFFKWTVENLNFEKTQLCKI